MDDISQVASFDSTENTRFFAAQTLLSSSSWISGNEGRAFDNILFHRDGTKLLMPVAIGQKLDSDFRKPLGLLRDCHRRIELFLAGLIAISEEAQGQSLDEGRRLQFEAALRYFREASPKHTRDEEDSLFPRLRAHKGGQADAALKLLETLHLEHGEMEILHQKLEQLGSAWLATESLSPDEARLFIGLLKDLRSRYENHIEVEEAQLFPLAENTLDNADFEAIAKEMADRRGLILNPKTSRQ